MLRGATKYDKYEPPRLWAHRCWLEPLTAGHAQHLFAPFTEPTLYTFIPGEPPQSEQVLWDRFTRLETRRSPDRSELWLNWAVKNRDRDHIGLVEATVKTDASVQIAYFIFAKHQGQGYGVEMTKTVLDHLTAVLDLKIARARVDTRNAASLRLLERLGFRRTRLIKNADTFKGAVSDEFEYELSLAR